MKIRKLKLKDAEYMLEWMHDDSVIHDLKTDFMSKTLDDCKEFICHSKKDLKNLHFAICDDDDNYMGTVSLKNIKSSTSEFGITVRKVAMGMGYSHYGMSEVLRIAFCELGLKKVYWCVSPNNVRACRFYDKNGYIKCVIPPKEIEGYTNEEIEKYIWYEIVKDSVCGEKS